MAYLLLQKVCRRLVRFAKQNSNHGQLVSPKNTFQLVDAIKYFNSENYFYQFGFNFVLKHLSSLRKPNTDKFINIIQKLN